jgi:hypothetical protein
LSIVRRPGVGGSLVDEEDGELGSVELSGRPVVERSQARDDHGVVEDAAEPVFELEIVLELAVGGVGEREDASHREEEVDRATAWVAEDGAAASDAAECEARRSDECVRVQDTSEDDVEEEALDSVLVSGEVTVVEVGSDDARVVRAIPGLRRRPIDECAIQWSTVSVDGEPGRPVARPKASQLSRRSRSFIARHQSLPGRALSGALSTPRTAIQRVKARAARRNRGRCDRLPVGSS